MPGDFFKLAGYNGPDTATAQLPGSVTNVFPADTLTGVFSRVNFGFSLANPVVTAFGSGSTGAAAGRITPDPVGLQISGGTAIPPIFSAFVRGQTIPRAYVFSTAAGQSGDWVARFFVFANVFLSQLQTFSDMPQGEYPLQFNYQGVLLGHVPSPGGAAVTSGWNFTGNRGWDGVGAI